MSSPTTEPGQRLLDAIFDEEGMPVDPGAAIVGIEVAAAANERSRLSLVATCSEPGCTNSANRPRKGATPYCGDHLGKGVRNRDVQRRHRSRADANASEAAANERRRLISLVATTMHATTRRFPMATVELREAAAALLDAFAQDGHA
jgi:hypothetical protein